MRYQNLLEGNNTKCIIVDVQPAYEPYINFEMGDLVRFIASQNAEMLMFVNADDTGLTDDNINSDIIPWWGDKFEDEDLDFTADGLQQMTFIDKGYGYFRAWMDQGVSDGAVIKTIRELYNQKKTDTRELFGGEESEHYVEQMQQLIGNEWDEWMIDDGLNVEWTSVGQLKKFSGAYLMGGGRDECLKEVELLMNAFNIKYKRVEDFVYG